MSSSRVQGDLPASQPWFRPPVVIEDVQPSLDAGRFAIKRELGDVLDVSADVFAEGHGLLAVVLKVRRRDDPDWDEVPMSPDGNDRWHGSFRLEQIGRYQYTIEAWRDVFGSWRADLRKRIEAGEDLAAEL